MNAHLVELFKHLIELEAEIKFVLELDAARACWKTLAELDVALKKAQWPLRNAIQSTLPVEMKLP